MRSNRFGIPGIISVIALVFAMAGGAYAAKKYVITSTSQISPSVLKKLKGPAGPKGPKGDTGSAGAKGDTGSAGAKGDTGSAGAKGDAGAAGAAGAKGEKGEEGEQGSPWSAGGVLPSKSTLTGAYFIGASRFPEEDELATAISFPIPLASETAIPDAAHTIYINGSETAEQLANCDNAEHAGAPSSANPEAKPGFLCVYKTFTSEMKEDSFRVNNVNSFGGGGVGVSGAVLSQLAEGPGAFAEGTWAVTAP